MAVDGITIDIDIRIFSKLPEEARAIREEVFVREQGFCEEFDTVDKYAIHFVAYDSVGKPIGTCRVFTKNDDSVYYLGRLAVLGDYRTKNIGRILVHEAERYANSKGASVMKLHAQCRAASFYEKCGYSQLSEIDFEEECPHVWMQKHLI